MPSFEFLPNIFGNIILCPNNRTPTLMKMKRRKRSNNGVR